MSRTEHKRLSRATELSSECWTAGSWAWRGRGRVRAAQGEAGVVLVRVNGLTTQTRAYKAVVGQFFRKEWRARPAAAGAFCVEILIDVQPQSPRHDVDNVAKAILDALTGAVFRDDSQVERLVVERRRADDERIWVRVSPFVGSAAAQRPPDRQDGA